MSQIVLTESTPIKVTHTHFKWTFLLTFSTYSKHFYNMKA